MIYLVLSCNKYHTSLNPLHMKKLLLILAVFITHFVFGQATITISRTSPSGSITSCEVVSFHVEAQNTSSTSQPLVITISTPGITSITSITTFSPPSGPSPSFDFDFGTISPGATVAFDFSYVIPCSDIPILTTSPPGLKITTATVSYSGIIQSTATINTSFDWVNLYEFVMPPPPIGYNLGHIGSVITRNIRLNCATSSGVGTRLFNGEMQFTDDYSGSCQMINVLDVVIQKYTSAGVAIGAPQTATTGPPGIYNFDMVAFGLHTNEYLILTERVEIIEEDLVTPIRCINDCPSARILSNLQIYWGCDGDPCHTITHEEFIEKDNKKPILHFTDILPISGPDVTCMIPSIGSTPIAVLHTKRIRNDGDANAYDVSVTLETSATFRTSGEPSTEFIFDGSTEISTSPSSITPIFTPWSIGLHTNLSTCADNLAASLGMNAIKTATFNIPQIDAHTNFDITYKTYRCCPDDENALSGNFLDPEYFDIWRLNGGAMTECEIDVSGTRSAGDRNNGPQMLHLTQRSIPGPTHLTGATPTGCNWVGTTVYHIQNLDFCDNDTRNAQTFEDFPGSTVHGTLRVRIRTQQGLNIDPLSTDINLKDDISASAVIVYPIASLTTTPYILGGSGGGEWEFYFPLQSLNAVSGMANYAQLKSFVDNSVFSFPLTPCCTGEEIPTYTLEWSINPYNDYPGAPVTSDSRSCTDCWIPIAKSVGEIHLMCPGCVTPGIITDEVSILRTSVGWPDLDNDGLADVSTPYTDMSDLITRGYPFANRFFMPGDELISDINASGQDGDNTNFGFDFSTLMNNWSLRSPFALPYPNQFNYLNIHITNPCLPEMSIVEATMQVNTGSGFVPATPLPPFDISGVVVRAGNACFFSIPYDAIGVGLTQYSVGDQYKVHLKYKACGNGVPMDCDQDVQMWWSANPHIITDISIPQAGDPNGLLPDTYTPTERINALSTNLRFFCEGNGDRIHRLQIEKTFETKWYNTTRGGSYWNTNTCEKRVISDVKLNLKDESPGWNFFSYEYRPLSLNFVSEHYQDPNPVAPPNYVYDHTDFASSLSTYLGASQIDHNISCSASIPGTYTDLYPALSTYTASPVLTIALQSDPIFDPLAVGYPAATSSSLYMGDENSSIQLYHYYLPTDCPGDPAIGELPYVDVATGASNVTINNELCTPSFPENIVDLTSYTTRLRSPTPGLILRLIDPPVNVYSVTENCFTLTISNPSGTQIAENVFIYVNAPTPTSQITRVTWSSGNPISIPDFTTVAPNYYLVNIAELLPGQSTTIEVCFNLSPCLPIMIPSLDFPITFGFSCVEAIDEVSKISTACFSEVKHITCFPARVSVSGDATFPPTIVQCATAPITCHFWVTNLGQVDNLHLYVTLPTGTSIVPLPTVSVTVSGGGTTYITPTMSRTAVGVGFYLYDIELPDDWSLPFATGPADGALMTFELLIGACVTGTVTPEIRLSGTTYCNDPISFPSLLPLPGLAPLSSPITVIPSSSCVIINIVGTKINPSCLGSHDGSVTLLNPTIPSGGPDPYTYFWSTTTWPTVPVLLSDLRDLTAVGAGTYYLTVTDVYGCEWTTSFELIAPASTLGLPTITATPFSTCDNGILTFTPFMLTPLVPANYSYSWTATNATIPFGTYTSLTPIGMTSYSFPVTFTNPNLPSTITIRATDNSDPLNPYPCYNEISVVINACCIRPEPMITNTTASAYWGLSSGSGPYSEYGTSYRVNGVFTIDHDINLHTVNLYMEPYTKIIVQPGAHLYLGNQTVIVACDQTMWNGIEVQGNGHLTINSGRVYDALAAITCDNGGLYNIEEAYFNRNYIDVDVLPNTTSPNLSTSKFCTYFCHTESPAYYGNTVPPSDGSMWTPHLTQKTFRGFNIRDNNHLVIGALDPSSSWDYTNYFSDMNYGIYAENSGVDAINNQFENILPLTGTTGGDAIYFKADDPSIGTYDKNINANKNVFGPVLTSPIFHACINLLGREVRGTIDENSMNGNFGVLSNYLGATFPLAHKPLNIISNSINYIGGGITLQSNKRENFYINGNYIYGPPPSSPSTGILVTTLTLNSDNGPQFTIINNSIYEGQNGIEIISSTPATGPPGGGLSFINSISRNGIYSEHTDRKNFRGIYILYSNSIDIRCNSINGLLSYNTPLSPATPHTINNRGIFLSSARANWISSNTIDRLNFGLSYMNTCTMPNMLAGNDFVSLNYHLYTGGTGTNIIGNQGLIPPPVYCVGCTTLFAANKLHPIPLLLPGRYSITNSGTPPSSYTYYKRPGFPIYDPISAGLYTPLPLLTISNVPTYVTSNYYENPAISCSVPVKITTFTPPVSSISSFVAPEEMSADGQNLAMDIKLSTELTFSEEEEGLKKMDEELLFDLLKSDSTLLENDTLAEFYNEKLEEHTGKLNEIIELINNKENETVNTKLDDLPINSEAEEINKVVFEIANNVTQRENYELEEEELNDLLTIAEYCPIRYGPAVYSARVLINTQYGNETLTWEDEELCTAGIDYRKSNIRIDEDLNQNNNIIIYPNPATSELNFKVLFNSKCPKGSISTVEITDVLGNIVLKKEYQEVLQIGKINILVLSKGMYIFKYSCGTTEIYRKSFVIN